MEQQAGGSHIIELDSPLEVTLTALSVILAVLGVILALVMASGGKHGDPDLLRAVWAFPFFLIALVLYGLRRTANCHYLALPGTGSLD